MAGRAQARTPSLCVSGESRAATSEAPDVAPIMSFLGPLFVCDLEEITPPSFCCQQSVFLGLDLCQKNNPF